MIALSPEAVRKVNLIRSRSDLTEAGEPELQQLFDWTDLPREAPLIPACLDRFGQVLGYRVVDNLSGGMLYLCVDSAETARELAFDTGAMPYHWASSSGPMGPQGYVGHTVLLSDDMVELVQAAFQAVIDDHRKTPPPFPGHTLP